MSDQTDKLIRSLEPYGLSADEAIIYLDLLENNTSSALSISRRAHIGRTKVYRLLDILIAKELVIQKFNDAGLTFVADSPSQLAFLLTKKEGELSTLRTHLPRVIEDLERSTQTAMKGSQILYYPGQKGLSQVNWHLLRAQGEFLSYEVDNAEAYLPKKEAEDLRTAIVAKQIGIRCMTNRSYMPSFTDVSGIVDTWEIRHVDPAVLTIKADIFIYNNVYAVVNYLSTKDVFCVEIYNEQLAEMQKAMFEDLWQRTKPLKVINEHGEARLE